MCSLFYDMLIYRVFFKAAYMHSEYTIFHAEDLQNPSFDKLVQISSSAVKLKVSLQLI